MSRTVRMKVSIWGFRYMGGPKWPDFNELLTTTDEEAAKLVAAGHAVYYEDEPVAKVDNRVPWHEVMTEDPYAVEEEERNEEVPVESDMEPVEYSDKVKRPATNDPKQDWIDYAVACGEDRDKAERQTKADLISRYGASILCCSYERTSTKKRDCS